MNFYKMEFHAHTEHSDGSFHPQALAQEAVDFGYDILSVTDHNTLTGYEALKEGPLPEGLLVFPGMEWTTFYGHVLVLGSEEAFDWQEVEKDTFDLAVAQLRERKAVVGLAHPFALGSPFCTGCHWDFTIEKWEQIAFIEVWNRENPLTSFRSQLAYELWRERLAEGYQIACSAGRDWHRVEDADRSTALTYIGLAERSQEAIRASIDTGNFYITMGPTLTLECVVGDERYQMGQEVPGGTVSLEVNVGPTEVARMRTFRPVAQEIWLFHGEECLVKESVPTDGSSIFFQFEATTYFRIEVRGRFEQQAGVPLTLSNPWYCQKAKC